MLPEPIRAPVGRLAPSPTGLLHLGHARTFLLAWWHLRQREGRVLLRIEDLDAPRCKEDFKSALCRDLEWLGLDWDAAPWLQSDGLPEMRLAVDNLAARGHVYPCICTRSDLKRALSAPHAGQGEVRYPGICRDRFASVEAARSSGAEPAIRFRVPNGTTRFNDSLFGPQSFDVSSECGDFVIARKDRSIAYQLAVVLDDARQGVTEVHRGCDLLASTARQWLLQEALGLPHPRWIHFPLVTDAHSRRLAKRADDLSLWELRQRGVDPRVIVSWAARSAGILSPSRVDALSLVREFKLELLPLESVRLDSVAMSQQFADTGDNPASQ